MRYITIPTLFTLVRILLTPFIVYAMVQSCWQKAFWLFVLAAVTDVIDGFLARLLHMRTFLGACLDACADKLLIVSCFATLAFIKTPLFIIPRWFVLLVLCKELILIGGSFIIYCLHGSIEIQPTMLGKGTTFVQICFIIWFFFCYFFQWVPIKTYNFFLIILILLVFASLAQYILIGTRSIVRKHG